MHVIQKKKKKIDSQVKTLQTICKITEIKLVANSKSHLQTSIKVEQTPTFFLETY